MNSWHRLEILWGGRKRASSWPFDWLAREVRRPVYLFQTDVTRDWFEGYFIQGQADPGGGGRNFCCEMRKMMKAAFSSKYGSEGRWLSSSVRQGVPACMPPPYGPGVIVASRDEAAITHTRKFSFLGRARGDSLPCRVVPLRWPIMGRLVLARSVPRSWVRLAVDLSHREDPGMVPYPRSP